MTTKTILGVKFLSGSAAEAVDAGLRGGLVVVPSAPVLVDVADKPALREAVLGADLAITDSGLMVLLWWLLTGDKLERVSGLEYLKLLLQKLRPETGDLKPEVSNAPEARHSSSGLRPQVSSLSAYPQVSGLKSQVSHAATGGVFWIMPTAAARDRNLTWLRSQGFKTTLEDCYVAPMYPADGPIKDQQLSSIIKQRNPSHIIIALGGGVQERLGFALKQSLAAEDRGPRTDDGKRRAGVGRLPSVVSCSLSGQGDPKTPNNQQPTTNNLAAKLPGIHCIGAAIGFLSGEQVRIPMWVDYLYLGWLWRSVSAPGKFMPRYWKATRLVRLMLRYRDKAPEPEVNAKTQGREGGAR